MSADKWSPEDLEVTFPAVPDPNDSFKINQTCDCLIYVTLSLTLDFVEVRLT